MSEIEPTECERRLAQWLYDSPQTNPIIALEIADYMSFIRLGSRLVSGSIWKGGCGAEDIQRLRRAVAIAWPNLPPELRVLVALKGWTDDRP